MGVSEVGAVRVQVGDAGVSKVGEIRESEMGPMTLVHAARLNQCQGHRISPAAERNCAFLAATHLAVCNLAPAGRKIQP